MLSRPSARVATRVKGADNLVKVTAQNETSVVVAEYAYFANELRSKKVVDNRGPLDGTTYFFYDGPAVIEERDGSENLVQQYIYGPNHIDEPLLITGANGTYWVHQDPNWNVMGLTTPSGIVAEEYNYTPYGRLLAKAHSVHGDVDSDGDVDDDDLVAFATAWQDPVTNYNAMFDADWDGDLDTFDENAFLARYNASGTSAIVPGRAWSPAGNDLGFTARRLDPETLLMHYRLRTYHPTLKQFIQRDPLGYIDGPNQYQYVAGNPLRYADPWGLECSTGRALDRDLDSFRAGEITESEVKERVKWRAIGGGIGVLIAGTIAGGWAGLFGRVCR
jgi:RHS repeat-associated protein